MYYVYMLRSQSNPTKTYVGFSEDLKQRLKDHNNGKSTHTARYKPWKLETYLAFSDRAQALDFESYLKSGSGIAFAAKRLCRGNPDLYKLKKAQHGNSLNPKASNKPLIQSGLNIVFTSILERSLAKYSANSSKTISLYSIKTTARKTFPDSPRAHQLRKCWQR